MKFNVFVLVLALWMAGVNGHAQCGSATSLAHAYSGAINTFSWSRVPNALNYQLEIVESGAYAPLELLATTTDTSFTTPGGLLSASYDWRIITTCQNGDTDTSAFATFTLPCPTPSALTTTAITQNSATLNWVNPYVQDHGVILAYRPLGGSWINLTTFSLGSSWVLNNLSPNTTYEWCANLNCPYFNSPPVIVQFTTLPAPCPAPTNPGVLNITNTSVRLNWGSPAGAGATAFTIQYKALNAATWTTITTPNANTQFLLTGLTINTAYQYRVASVCGSNNASAFTAPFTFYTNCVSLNNSAEHIRYVLLNSIQRTSGAEPDGYVFQNTINTQLVAGATYQLKVRAGFSGQAYPQNFAVYLDVNGNGAYEHTERIVGVGLISNGNIRTYNLTIPAQTAPGPNKLRIVLLRQNQGFSVGPCVPVGSLGEMEDYAITILPQIQSVSAASGQDDDANVVAADLGDETPEQPLETAGEVVLMPNPAQGEFTILSATPIVRYTLYNAHGSLVETRVLPMAITAVPVSLGQIPSGLYFVQTTDEEQQTKTLKLAVRR
jgi:hypothetical protein